MFVGVDLNTRKLAIWIIGVPMIVAIFYYSFLSLDRYVSTAQVAVRQTGSQDMPTVPGLAVMLGGVNPTSREETLYVREYIRSMDMLNLLESKLKFHEHYAGKWRDPLFWLSENASKEDLLMFYRRVVNARFDEQTGLLSVEVQSFDKEFARQILTTILIESERLVNELSHRMARDQMTFAQTELGKARQIYEDRRNALLEFQGENNLLDAEAAAKSRAETIANLESTLTMERASLKGLRARLGDDTPQVRQQSVKIRAIEQQLEAENKRLLSEKSGDRLNVVASRYRNLTIDSVIAEEAYKFAVSAVETARIEASKKLRSLVTVVSPNAPDMAIYPEKIYNLITLLIGLTLLFGIVRFIVATVQDHRD